MNEVGSTSKDEANEWIWRDLNCPELTELDTLFRCAICGDLMRVPMVLENCAHAFCSQCLRQSLVCAPQSAEECCPACRKPARFNDIRPNLALSRVIDCFVGLRPRLLKRLQSAALERPTAIANGLADVKHEAPVEPIPAVEEIAEPLNARPRRARKEIVEIVDVEDIYSDDSTCSTLSNNSSSLEPANIRTAPVLPTPQTKDFRVADTEESLQQLLSQIPARMTIPVFHLLRDRDLRAMLKKHGVPDTGPKDVLAQRFRIYICYFNAAVDALHLHVQRRLAAVRSSGAASSLSSASAEAAWSEGAVGADFQRMTVRSRDIVAAMLRADGGSQARGKKSKATAFFSVAKKKSDQEDAAGSRESSPMANSSARAAPTDSSAETLGADAASASSSSSATRIYEDSIMQRVPETYRQQVRRIREAMRSKYQSKNYATFHLQAKQGEEEMSESKELIAAPEPTDPVAENSPPMAMLKTPSPSTRKLPLSSRTASSPMDIDIYSSPSNALLKTRNASPAGSSARDGTLHSSSLESSMLFGNQALEPHIRCVWSEVAQQRFYFNEKTGIGGFDLALVRNSTPPVDARNDITGLAPEQLKEEEARMANKGTKNAAIKKEGGKREDDDKNTIEAGDTKISNADALYTPQTPSTLRATIQPPSSSISHDSYASPTSPPSSSPSTPTITTSTSDSPSSSASSATAPSSIGKPSLPPSPLPLPPSASKRGSGRGRKRALPMEEDVTDANGPNAAIPATTTSATALGSPSSASDASTAAAATSATPSQIQEPTSPSLATPSHACPPEPSPTPPSASPSTAPLRSSKRTHRADKSPATQESFPTGPMSESTPAPAALPHSPASAKIERPRRGAPAPAMTPEGMGNPPAVPATTPTTNPPAKDGSNLPTGEGDNPATTLATAPPGTARSPVRGWGCKHCTLVNRPRAKACTACGMPRE